MMDNRRLLENVLSDAAEETNFSYNDAFSPRNYEIRELKYSEGMAEYNVKRDKIIIKKDIFNSFNKKLVLNVIRPAGDLNDKDDILTLKLGENVDVSFIKNHIIKHEEAHRQVRFLRIKYSGLIPETRYHSELFFYVLMQLNGYVPDVYIKEDEGSYHTSYGDFKNSNNENNFRNAFLINKKSSSYINNKDIAAKIEKYYAEERTGKILAIIEENGDMKAISNGKLYSIKFDLDFNSNSCKIDYIPIAAF